MKRLLLFLSLLALLTATSCRKPVQLVLGTYNLHHCEPPTGDGRDYAEISRTIMEMAPDVIALQELDSCNTRSPEYQAAQLAELCGMEYLYNRTIPFGGGSYGIGMLYKPSLGLVGSAFIPLPGEEPRGALVAEFERFVYVSTHLCYKSEEHRTQSLDIIKVLLGAIYGSTGKPVLVAGDFNSPHLFYTLPSWTEFSTDRPTFSHNGEGTRIDYIVLLQTEAAKKTSLQGSCVFSGAEGLSDHLPVLSTVRIR